MLPLKERLQLPALSYQPPLHVLKSMARVDGTAPPSSALEAKCSLFAFTRYITKNPESLCVPGCVTTSLNIWDAFYVSPLVVLGMQTQIKLSPAHASGANG